MAACLGFFFRKHPNYFKNIDEFVFGEGIECFNEFMEKWHPKYMLHGHVHKSYQYKFVREREHASGTKIINAYEYTTLDIGDDEHPAQGRTGSALYDLYMNLKTRK